MNNLIKKELTLDSRDVAEMLNKTHAELLQEIEGRRDGKGVGVIPVLTKGKFHLVDYFIESTYLDRKNETRKCYLITKAGCEILGNKQQGEKGILFTARYVERFNKMEKALGGVKEISKAEKSNKVGGINGLVRTLNSIMKEEDLPAWKRAEVLKSIMEQYGLDIPEDFVRKPSYIQLSLTIPIGN